MGASGQPDPGATLLAMLDQGLRPDEGETVRLVRSPACPARVVESLAGCRWVLGCRRLLPLLVRHPACPRSFAWEALPRLGWHDLLEVTRDPRTSPPVLRQAERKLIARIPQLTTGERTGLARRASRAVLAALLGDPAPGCIQALLDNPQLVECDALRIVANNPNPTCVLAVLRHPRWGASTQIVRAALHCLVLPLPVALGLLASLSASELSRIVCTGVVGGALKDAAIRLLRRRAE
ncbi:MAG: hypothetical protein V1750_07500 [Acidobacteriota bacterium]